VYSDLTQGTISHSLSLFHRFILYRYVTIPDFAVKAEKVRSLTNAVYLNVYAAVPLEERYLWEQYSAEHGPKWVEETLELQVRDGTFAGVFDDLNLTDSNITYWDVIHDYDEWEKEEEEQGMVGLDPSDPGPFLVSKNFIRENISSCLNGWSILILTIFSSVILQPMWQTSPLIPVDPPYNW